MEIFDVRKINCKECGHYSAPYLINICRCQFWLCSECVKKLNKSSNYVCVNMSKEELEGEVNKTKA